MAEAAASMAIMEENELTAASSTDSQDFNRPKIARKKTATQPQPTYANLGNTTTKEGTGKMGKGGTGTTTAPTNTNTTKTADPNAQPKTGNQKGNTSGPNGPGGSGGSGGGGSGGSGDSGGGGGSGGAPGPAPAPGQGAGGTPAPFALTPALIKNTYLDYTNPADVKLYNKAVQPLEPEFDLDPSGLKLFLENLKQRAFVSNWNNTLTVPSQGIVYNLIDEYGTVSLEDVRRRAMIYHGRQTRSAQNSVQILNCLTATLTETARARVALESESYTINGSPDGVLYLKVILRLAHIDTKATVNVIRTRLSTLDTKMAELQDDIITFNEYVKTQRAALSARGETTFDLLVNLFKAYKVVGDSAFQRYIEAKENTYNEGWHRPSIERWSKSEIGKVRQLSRRRS